MRWARMFSAASSTLKSGSTSDCARQDQNGRIRRVDLAIGRRAREGFRQVAGGGVDRGLDVVGGRVDVAIEIELHDDRRRAERARRGHFRDAGNLGDLALQRLGDRGGHRLRRGAGQIGAHRDRGEVDLRQRGHRQQGVGDEADEENRGHQQRRRHRSMYEGSGDAAIHGSAPARRGAGARRGRELPRCVRKVNAPNFLGCDNRRPECALRPHISCSCSIISPTGFARQPAEYLNIFRICSKREGNQKGESNSFEPAAPLGVANGRPIAISSVEPAPLSKLFAALLSLPTCRKRRGFARASRKSLKS